MKRRKCCGLAKWRYGLTYISVLWLIFVNSVSTEDNGLACSPGVRTPGWTMPKGDIILEHGQPLKIFCTLDLTQDVAKGRNASHLVFYHGGELVPPKYVTAINESTAFLYIPSPPLSNEMYYCKLKLSDDQHTYSPVPYTLTSLEASGSSQTYEPIEIPVCLNNVAIGTKPAEVKNFSCVSYNWESLVCSWTPPFNYIKTVYRVYYQTPGRSGRRTMYPCPMDRDVTENMCNWTSHSNPLYRRTFEYLTFTIIGENSLGNTSTSVKFHHFAHVIPSPPSNLRVIDKTISSVLLQWSIGLLSIFEKGLTYKVQYKWNNALPWNTAVYHQKEVNKMVDEEVSLNITGLPYPNTPYDFRVSMKSAVASGDSAWSEATTIIVKTKPCAPYIAPEIDVGSFEIPHVYPTYRDVYVYWQSLSRYEQNGEEFHYEVFVIDEYNHFVNLKPSVVTSSYAKFNNLGLSSYRFLITSVNKEGSSSSSEIFLPSNPAVIQEPLVFTKIDFGDGIYELSWKHHSTFKDSVTDFTIFWCESNRERPYQCDGYLDWIHLPKNMTIYNITVNSKKGYQFAISANSENSSSGMVWASCTVLHDKVGKMKNVWVNKVGSDFIELSWKLECSDRVEGIKGYQIFYCPTISPDNVNCREPEKNVTIFGDVSTTGGNVTSLKPYTSYKISTAVFTKDGGPGPRSDDLFNHTLDGAPDVEGIKIDVLEVTNLTVSLTWGQPKSMNGVFQYYEIRYNGHFARTSNDTRIILTGLRSYTDYEVSVLACTKLCSQIGKPVQIRTKVGIPGTVQSLTAHKINSSYALVKWNVPLSKAAPYNMYSVTVQKDDFNENSTVYEINTNSTEVIVPVPECKNENTYLSYTFYVRALNTMESSNITHPEYLIGDTSPAYSINCVQSATSLLFKIGTFCATVVFSILMFFIVRKGMYKCKQMKKVEVTLPPDFTIPALFDIVKNDFDDSEWKGKSAELDRLNIKRYEAEFEEEIENAKLNNGDFEEKEKDFDTDPYSSGCCTGHNSTTSSVTGGTHNSDSGTEMELKPNLNVLCDLSPTVLLRRDVDFGPVDNLKLWDPKQISEEDTSMSWIDCYPQVAQHESGLTQRTTPGYVTLQTLPSNSSAVQTNATGYVSLIPNSAAPFPGNKEPTEALTDQNDFQRGYCRVSRLPDNVAFDFDDAEASLPKFTILEDPTPSSNLTNEGSRKSDGRNSRSNSGIKTPINAKF